MVSAPWPVAGLSAAVFAAAVALLLGSWFELLPSQLGAWTTRGSAQNSTTTTYCYAAGITTLADDRPTARCFSVAGDRFTAIFTPEDTDAADDATPPTLLPGHVIPGLWDGHGHLIAYGESLASVDLFGATSAADVRHRLAAFRATHPDDGGPGRWLRGFGWDQMRMGGAMPTADDLAGDENDGEDGGSLAGLYMLLDRVDAHCIWVSPAVLALLPQDVLDGDPEGGEIVRDPGLGVFCDNAMAAVLALWPRPDRATKTRYIRLAMAALREHGLVGMHDAGVVPEDLALYQELVGQHTAAVDEGDTTDEDPLAWTLRVYAMVECPERNTFCPEAVRPLRQQERRSPYLSIRSVKLFADGALGSWGSALLEPYSDRPDTSGALLVPNCSVLVDVARQWASVDTGTGSSGAGFQVCIHAIGDRAARCAVDAFEAALTLDLCPAQAPATCQHDRARFRLEHAQIVHPRDQARIHALQLIPSVQPTHATSDMAYAEARLGHHRTATEAYRMRSFLHGWRDDDDDDDDANGKDHPPHHPLVLGSDFPIEPPDPFQGLYAAVARRSPHSGKGADGRSTDPWYPQEALTLDEALVGFTRGPAYAAFLDGQAGVIQPGALADWVVLDRPLHDYDLEDLRSMRVRETWVGGRRVYKRP